MLNYESSQSSRQIRGWSSLNAHLPLVTTSVTLTLGNSSCSETPSARASRFRQPGYGLSQSFSIRLISPGAIPVIIESLSWLNLFSFRTFCKLLIYHLLTIDKSISISISPIPLTPFLSLPSPKLQVPFFRYLLPVITILVECKFRFLVYIID